VTMISRGSTPAFVGRVPELAALIEAFDDARAGRATTALVGGQAGVGKSRLVRELGAHARLDRVMAAAAVDPVVNAAFFDVVALLATPTSLMRPALMARVLGRRHETPDSELSPAPRPLVPAREPE
jgi:hypothetical protein